jgi:hypothetical protein
MKKYILIVITLLYSFLNVNILFAETWTQKADFGGTDAAAQFGISIGVKGYIWERGTKYFWEYDPATNIWTQMADFGGTIKANPVGFSIGSKGYIGTGSAGASYSKEFWEYDPATNTWTKKADFGGTERSYAVGFSIGSKGYIGTGSVGSSYYKDFWEYDPDKDNWTQKADFGGTEREWAVGFFMVSKGYIGTGHTSSGSKKDFWEYDPGTDIWTQKADFGGMARYAAIAFSIGSKGYTGAGYAGSYPKDFWEYDPAGSITPSPFNFIDQTNVELSTTVTSNTITVSGITSATSITIAGGTYSINGGSYTSAGGTVNNGDTVTVQLTSSGNYSTTTNATLTIGGVSDTFSVTTLAGDSTPDQFTFKDKKGASLNKVYTSDTITVSGITVGTPISITGGTYSINGGSYTGADDTVNNGDTVTVQKTSSGSYSTAMDATLTIGGVSDTFSVTTKSESTGGGGGGCFIATAAFGSPLAGQIEILRQFRDKYLLTYAPGQKFVAWYYRNGPVAASWIKDKPLAKATVRVALYPLIGFSFLLISGYLPFVSIVLLLSTLLFLRFRPKKVSVT